MKPAKFILALALPASIALAAACDLDFSTTPEPRNVLFPETQEGKNTFACYVDGELFSSNKLSYYFGEVEEPSKALHAIYNKAAKVLTIYCRCRNDKNDDANSIFATFRMWVVDPIANTEMKISEIENYYYYQFLANNGHYDSIGTFYFLGKDTGCILLTRFDTINNIVAARFSYELPLYLTYTDTKSRMKQFNAYLNLKGDSVMHLTQGRFDLDLIVK
jgi:hypothetical protein